MQYPAERNATRHAWNRLRKHVTDSELKDIARDITAYLLPTLTGYRSTAAIQRLAEEVRAEIAHALIAYPWADKRQK